MTWPEATIAEIAAPGGVVGGPFGSELGRDDYVPSGVPVIRGANLASDGSPLDLHDLVFVTEAKADALAQHLALPGDLVVTQRGTLGQVGVVPADHPRWLVSQSQMRLRCDAARACPRYVFYWLLAPATQAYVRANGAASGVPHVNLAFFRGLRLPLPPLPVQREIAAALALFDAKLALGRARAEALRGAMQAFFRRLLLDPGERRGWSRVPLDVAASFRNGLPLQNYPALAGQEGLPAIKIAQLHAGHSEGAERVGQVPPAYRVDDGDLLFSWSGTLTVALWTGGPGALNQHLFKVESAHPRWLIHGWLSHHLPRFRAIAADKATTLGHIRRQDLRAAEVLIPPPAQLARLGALFAPLEERLLAGEREQREVRRTRDLLLPRLLSGQIRVRGAAATPGV